MNQEQLLDHVADLLKTEAEKGPGTLLLVFTDDFHVLRLDIAVGDIGTLLGFFDANKVIANLPPSVWLELSKKVWACKSSTTGSIKFPPQPPAGSGKPGRKPKPQDEDPKTG
jgi:hypothetical protein